MAKKTILVACGAGIATSTVLYDRLEKLLKKNHIVAELRQCKIAEVASIQKGCDLIVSSTLLPRHFDIPSVVATSYISGIGIEKTDKKILEYLQ